MYLFILESIGMSELILIGIVALIIFGPRKLPGIARTVGKTIADLKKTTNDFKETWEKESSMMDIKSELKDFSAEISQIKNISLKESIEKNIITDSTEARQALPAAIKTNVNEIKYPTVELVQNPAINENQTSEKQSWL